MVSMEMGNKNVVNSGKLDPILSKLHLGPFTAINQKKMVLYFKYLGSGIGKCSWCSGIAT